MRLSRDIDWAMGTVWPLEGAKADYSFFRLFCEYLENGLS